MSVHIAAYRCGCHVLGTEAKKGLVFPDASIEWCPLHAQASEMQELLKILSPYLDGLQNSPREGRIPSVAGLNGTTFDYAADHARALLAALEEGA